MTTLSQKNEKRPSTPLAVRALRSDANDIIENACALFGTIERLEGHAQHDDPKIAELLAAAPKTLIDTIRICNGLPSAPDLDESPAVASGVEFGASMRAAAERLARVRGLADDMLSAPSIASRERAYLNLLAELRAAHDACLFFADPKAVAT